MIFVGSDCEGVDPPPAKRTAIREFDLDFIERKFGAQLADEILRAALQFLRLSRGSCAWRDFVQAAPRR